MSRRDLVSKVAHLSGLNAKQVADCLDALLIVMRETLKISGKVSLKYIGVFRLVTSKPRVVYNVNTKQNGLCSESSTVKFKASGNFLKQSNNSVKTKLMVKHKLYNVMRMHEMIELEKKNAGCIYFCMNEEGNFMAYELSAYLLSRLYKTVCLKEIKDVEIQPIFVSLVPVTLIQKEFIGYNVSVGNDYITVNLLDEQKNNLPIWLNEYQKAKGL